MCSCRQNSCRCEPKKKCGTKFSFDVIGDTGYSTDYEQELRMLINNVINKECVDFVVHIGDMQTDPRGLPGLPTASIALNTPEWIVKRNLLWEINKPFIVTPGDNDWADTIQAPTSNPNPLATLQSVREVFYNNGTNVPFKFPVVSQPEEFPAFSAYVENRRWVRKGVLFTTFHSIAGREANGLTSFNSAVAAESLVRIQAAVAWINRSFDVAIAEGYKAMVFLSQAVIDWTNPLPGFVEIVNAMTTRVNQNQNIKVLYIFGDNHQFNVQKPMRGAQVSQSLTPLFRQYENFTAVEVPGAPRGAIGGVGMTNIAGGTARVKFTVDVDSRDIFSISLDTHTQVFNS